LPDEFLGRFKIFFKVIIDGFGNCIAPPDCSGKPTAPNAGGCLLVAATSGAPTKQCNHSFWGADLQRKAGCALNEHNKQWGKKKPSSLVG
jgi:hypothetical protein